MAQQGAMKQWGWPEMEHLLQCPVCLEPAKGIVEQCQRGHHVCGSCRPLLQVCPICNARFKGTRNFVVEELVRNLQILKNTMLLNNVSGKSKGKTKIVPEKPLKSTLLTPKHTRGEYPCRIGDCEVKFPLARLLNHVRSFHKECLTESAVDYTNIYSQTMQLTYRTRKSTIVHNFALSITKIGLIFINLEILRSGDVIVIARMATRYKVSQNYVATLEIFGNESSFKFSSKLVSVRDNIPSMLQKNECLTVTRLQMRNVCVDKKFQLKITVQTFSAALTLLTTPNTEQINIIAAKRASLHVPKIKNNAPNPPARNGEPHSVNRPEPEILNDFSHIMRMLSVTLHDLESANENLAEVRRGAARQPQNPRRGRNKLRR